MKSYKYIIVGQGLAGTLLSYQLLKRGVKHIVVASDAIKQSSLVAAGMINPLVFKRITKSWMVDELLPVMFQNYLGLEKLLNQKLLVNKPIAKLIRAEEKTWWHERIKKQNLGLFIKRFNSQGFIEGVNSELESVIINQSGYLNIPRLIDNYRRLLIHRGIFVEEKIDYSDIKFTKDKLIWKGYLAEKVVFCEGVAGRNNPFFKEVEFYATKGEVIEVEINGLSEDYILNKDFFLMPIGQNRYYLGSTYNHTDLNWKPTTEALNLLLEKAKRIISLPIKPINQKAGIRPTIKDRRPVLGIHPNIFQLAYFNGLGTKGVMLAPYFSQEMYELLNTPGYQLNSEVNLNRFYR